MTKFVLVLLALYGAACVPGSPEVTGKLCTPDRSCGTGYFCDNGRCARGAPTTTPIPTEPTLLIPRGSVWKYLEASSDPPAAWKTPSFDDSGWKSGKAPLGYGSDDAIVTFLSPPGTAQYYRLTVQLGDLTPFATFTARFRRDDALVLYLNGTELLRSSLPAGTITYSTLATESAGSPEELSYYELDLSTASFAYPTNVFAAEVHQRTVDSNDSAFDFELSAAP